MLAKAVIQFRYYKVKLDSRFREHDGKVIIEGKVWQAFIRLCATLVGNPQILV
jgi:hypothetical protein